jgi:hypothetical protein
MSTHRQRVAGLSLCSMKRGVAQVKVTRQLLAPRAQGTANGSSRSDGKHMKRGWLVGVSRCDNARNRSRRGGTSAKREQADEFERNSYTKKLKRPRRDLQGRGGRSAATARFVPSQPSPRTLRFGPYLAGFPSGSSYRCGTGARLQRWRSSRGAGQPSPRGTRPGPGRPQNLGRLAPAP